VLYLVVCAVPGAERTVERVRAERANGWEVCVVATERALYWFDVAEVEQATGHPIQSRMRRFGEPLFEPLGDAVIVAPASFNTINRIGAGFRTAVGSQYLPVRIQDEQIEIGRRTIGLHLDRMTSTAR